MGELAIKSEVTRDLTVHLPSMSPHINAAIVAALLRERNSAEEEDEKAIDAIVDHIIEVESTNMGNACFMRMILEALKS